MSADLNPIPFGAQYYRAPVPLKQDWEADFAVMKDTGLDCVKLWIQWRWNHPAVDEYDFSDIDGLCDTAERHGLKVVLNTIMDVAPAWLFQRHPDAYMVTSGGRVAYPHTTACRQIGGIPGPCYHHQGAWKHAWEFLAAAAERFAKHPAVWGWDLWNEPELSMAHRYRCEEDDLEAVCYCDHTRKAFADWLLAKYGGLDAINAAHSRNYRRPEEIETPRWRETYKDFIDWRVFFCDTLAENMRRRAEIVRDHAPGQRIVTHTVPPTALSIVNSANDEWKLAEPVEEFGASFPTVAPFGYEMDMNRSAGKGKRLWSAEFYIGCGGNPHVTPAYVSRVRRQLFRPLFHDYKAYLLWQWRREKIGREGGFGAHAGIPQPDWPAIALLKQYVGVLREHGQWLSKAEAAKPKVAILFNPENELFTWCVGPTAKLYHDSMVGTHQALEALNVPTHFVHPDEVVAGKLADYAVLIMPEPFWVPGEIASPIRDWVSAGGTLIAEAHFAGRDPANGFTVETIPGLGFHEVFGAKQIDCYPRWEWNTAKGADTVTLKTAVKLRHLPAGSELVGHMAAETYELSGAEVLATIADGRPAGAMNRFGKGTAVLLGSLLSAPHLASRSLNFERLLLSLLGDEVAEARPIVEGDAPIIVSTLTGDGKEWIYIENPADKPAEVRFSLPGDAPAGAYGNLLNAEAKPVMLSAKAGRRTGSVSLAAGEVALLASR